MFTTRANDERTNPQSRVLRAHVRHESIDGQMSSDGCGSIVHWAPTKPVSHGADVELLGLKNQLSSRTMPVSAERNAQWKKLVSTMSNAHDAVRTSTSAHKNEKN